MTLFVFFAAAAWARSVTADFRIALRGKAGLVAVAAAQIDA
jgi:hypothetical protein